MLPTPVVSSTGVTTAVRIVVRVLVAELVVLAATGVALFFWYRPSTTQAWELATGMRLPGVGAIGHVRAVHRVTSMLALWTALAAAVLIVVEPTTRRRWLRSLALGVAMLLAVLAASGTGYLLPWDQLALWAVTVGTDMKGYLPLLDDDVRFVLLGGKEIGKSTLLRWVVIHAVLGIVAIVLAGAALRRLRVRPSTSSAVDPTASGA